jgi:O-antigen/teichoic acid export membrane protein
VYFIARIRPARRERLAGGGQPPAGRASAGGPGDGRPGSQGPEPAEAVAAILRAAVRPVLVASALSAGLLLAFAGPLAHLLLGGPLARHGAAAGPAASAIRALAVAVPFAALADTYLGASRGFRNMLPTVVVDRITRPAAQVAGLIAAVAVGRAALLAPLWALPYFPAGLAAWLWLRRTRRQPAPATTLHALGRPEARPAPPEPGTYPAQLAPRPVLREVPPALAVLLALSTTVPPRDPAADPPPHPSGSRQHQAHRSTGWTVPVPPPRSGTGPPWAAHSRIGPRAPSAAPRHDPAVPGPPGDPAKPPPGAGSWPQAVSAAPHPDPAGAGPPWEPATQPLWDPASPGLPWNEVLAPPVYGPPWAAAAPPPQIPARPEPAEADRRHFATDLSPAKCRRSWQAEPDGAGGQAEPDGAAGFWSFTGPRAVATVAQIVVQRLDIVLVAVISGPAQAAVYAAATRFLVAGQLANAALIQAAQPQLSRLFAIGDRPAAAAVYRATTAWLILLTWPLYLLSAQYGPQLLAVFGHSYASGARVVVILALAMLLATACGQVDLVLTTTGRSRWSLQNGLLAMTVNVAVDVALIPRQGITGAAIGWAAALAVSNLIPLAQVAVVAKVHPFGRGPAAAIGVTAVAFGAVPLAARAALGPGLPAALAGGTAGAVLAVAGLWAFRGALGLAVLPGLSAGGRKTQFAQVAAEKMNTGRPANGRR